MDNVVQPNFAWLTAETVKIKQEHGLPADAPVFVCIKCRRVVRYTPKNKMACSCYQNLKETA